jgi:predicted nucleotidyltransferase
MSITIDQAMAEATIRFAYLFGSRATGTATEHSDADVAIMPSATLSLRERARLATQLTAALGVPDVDLLSLDRARLELRGRVVQEGKLIYSSDEPARVAFEVRTRSAYFDYLPTLQELQQAYLTHVAEHGL